LPSNHHGHGHTHAPEADGRLSLTWKNLAALGVAGGLVPSASALVILLAAISMHRIGFGLLLILTFSAGMAGVLAGVGLLLVYAGRLVERFRFEHRSIQALGRVLPVATALVVLVSGLVLVTRAVLQVGLL
jgi:ABC-type nickel/cobalt efflux system permease component RcnA